MGTDYVDLYQLHNCRIDAVRDDALWETLDALVAEGKVRALGVALGPAIGWVEEGLESIRDREHLLAADGVQRARAGARPHVRAASRRSPTAR